MLMTLPNRNGVHFLGHCRRIHQIISMSTRSSLKTQSKWLPCKFYVHMTFIVDMKGAWSSHQGVMCQPNVQTPLKIQSHEHLFYKMYCQFWNPIKQQVTWISCVDLHKIPTFPMNMMSSILTRCFSPSTYRRPK